jgi:hypothetical protein
VRGTAWLDTNADGIRQPWETPLAGVTVTVAGQTAVTDAEGRYTLYSVAPGTHTLTTSLPSGLMAEIGAMTVGEGRGAAVGVAAVPGSIPTDGHELFLPVVARP